MTRWNGSYAVAVDTRWTGKRVLVKLWIYDELDKIIGQSWMEVRRPALQRWLAGLDETADAEAQADQMMLPPWE